MKVKINEEEHPKTKGRIAWGTYDSNIVGYNHYKMPY